MNSRVIINGTIHSPYFIFLRTVTTYADRDLLQRFGLPEYRSITDPPRLGRHVCITNDDHWTHIADDWFYTLWHMPATRQAIAEIAVHCDVFTCSVGESDESYDFGYYRNGRFVRSYVVDDPQWRGGKVVQDIGQRIHSEWEAKQHKDQLQIVLSIASSLGIDLRHESKHLRFYAPPHATKY